MNKGETSKILVKNTTMLYIMNITKIILPLVTLPYLTRVLSKECYGVVSYVKEVMRYAGPRLLFRHPVLTILHGWVTLRQKRLQKKQEKHDK